MVTYFTDSDTDVTLKQATDFGYKYISMPYAIGLESVYPYVDFDEFDYKAFYDILRAGTLPTTSALPKEAYIKYFEPEFKAGNDIFYVHFSRNMTATFNFMDQAVAELKEKYPERKFYEVDTKGITLGAYNATCEIGDMIKRGTTPEEILAWASTEIDKFVAFFYAEDLKFFRRSGRVGGLKAMMGNFLGIRPLITMSSAGKMETIGSEKGRDKVIAKLISFVEEYGEDIKAHRFVIGHTDCLEGAKLVEQKLKERFGDDLPTEIVVSNPTAGSHCGPNDVGISFHAKHRYM